MTEPLRLLVCGNRDWTCTNTIRAWLMPFHARWQKIGGIAPLLVHGACGERDEKGTAFRGADELAHDIAFALGWRIWAFPADWDTARRAGRPNSAGPIRNRKMLAEAKPHRGLAFGRLWKPNGDLTGTGGMFKLMVEAGLLCPPIPVPGLLPTYPALRP